MTLLIVICVASFGWLIRLLRQDRCSLGLPVAYLFSLLLIQVPGALATMFSSNLRFESGITEVGMRFVAVASVCFVIGVWLAHRLIPAMRVHAVVDLKDAGADLRPGIVHRLDKDTSGLMIIAKNTRTQAALVEQMKRHQVVKRYLALVEGNVALDQGSIDAPIGRVPELRIGGHHHRLRCAHDFNPELLGHNGRHQPICVFGLEHFCELFSAPNPDPGGSLGRGATRNPD